MAPTIYPSDHADAKALARRLLDVAGPDRRDEVQTITDGPLLGLAFDVSDDVYSDVFLAEAEPSVSARGPRAREEDGGDDHGSVHHSTGYSPASTADHEPAAVEDAPDRDAAANADASADSGPATSIPRPRRRAR